jgi:hypothetical protein
MAPPPARRGTMDWTRIEREGAPEVRGIHPRHPDRLDVVISLSGSPPGEWIRFLIASYQESPWKDIMDFPLPDVQADSILIAPKDEDLKGWVEGLDKRIEEANEFYEKQVLPQVQAKEKRKEAAEEGARRRVEEAKRQAKEL